MKYYLRCGKYSQVFYSIRNYKISNLLITLKCNLQKTESFLWIGSASLGKPSQTPRRCKF